MLCTVYPLYTLPGWALWVIYQVRPRTETPPSLLSAFTRLHGNLSTGLIAERETFLQAPARLVLSDTNLLPSYNPSRFLRLSFPSFTHFSRPVHP